MNPVTAAIHATLNGNRDAYRIVVESEQAMLFAYASLRLPDKELVEEAVQQTFIAAWEQLADFDKARDLGVWLRAICFYKIKALLKRRQLDGHNRRTATERLQQLIVQAAAERLDAEEQHDASARRADHLQACLDNLAEQARTLVELRYNEGAKSQQIAETLERTPSWVTTTLSRVRKQLKVCIEQREVQA